MIGEEDPTTLLTTPLGTRSPFELTDEEFALAQQAKTTPDVLDDRTEPYPWDDLQPRGLYYELGRPLLNLTLFLFLTPWVFLVGGVITLINAIQFRSLTSAFYDQPRVGYRGQVFRIYKFRTMRPAEGSVMNAWSTGKDVMRVTRFGRLLRNTHLDELPQFLNILKGDMTFIGPRPEMVEIEEWAQQHVHGFERRLAIKPGITGLAQITQGYVGHDSDGYQEKLELNDRMREEMSLTQDVAIIFRTITWMLRGRGWNGGKAVAAAASTATSESKPEGDGVRPAA